MKITETVTRDCCHPTKDLKPVEFSPILGHDPEYKFCVHCGARWKLTGYMDAAGSRDWEYRKVMTIGEYKNS